MSVYKLGEKRGIEMKNDFYNGTLEINITSNKDKNLRMILMTEELEVVPYDKETNNQVISNISKVKYLLLFYYSPSTEWDLHISCKLEKIHVYEIQRIDIIDRYIECIDFCYIERDEYLEFYSNIQKNTEVQEDVGLKMQLLYGLLGKFFC